MDNNEKKKIGRSLEPIMRIGKAGLTESIIVEIKKHLKRKKIIKIKFLRSSFAQGGKQTLFAEIAEKTQAELIDATGFVVLLGQKEQNINNKGNTDNTIR